MLVALLATGCGSARESVLATRTAPDPTGCYVQIYSEPDYKGAREFVNGPRKYATLSNMPGRVSWRNRIKSLRVGPAITQVVLWTDEVFTGARWRLEGDRSIPRLNAPMSGAVESLEIDCSPQPLPTW